MRIIFILVVAILAGSCSQEQAASSIQAAGKTYNESNRDNVIKNWQTRVEDSDRCSSFRQRFHVAGIRHESAVTGRFVNDMQKIMSDVKAANCEYKQ